VAGENQFHAIFGGGPSYIVHPSDTAPALVALDAKMVIRSSDGERVVDAESYFIGPSTDITRMTVLKPGELLTAIRVPATWAGAEFYFEKVRERQVWDFPLVNIAAAFKVSNGNITSSRIVVNAVAARPMRLKSVEDAVAGKPRNEETATMAGELAVQGARPLAHNGYKIPLVRNLVKRAIRGGAQA
jgi:xanthine dehydrogenase YagS FAD-binding subunit